MEILRPFRYERKVKANKVGAATLATLAMPATGLIREEEFEERQPMI